MPVGPEPKDAFYPHCKHCEVRGGDFLELILGIMVATFGLKPQHAFLENNASLFTMGWQNSADDA